MDTQFASDEWLPGEAVADAVRQALPPSNHVRVGGGYPDIVGLATLDEDRLGVQPLGEGPSVVAVAAKGYSGDGRVDVERGVVQALDRLQESNVAFLSVPEAAVLGSVRALACELNVGGLGETNAGDVVVLERPRLVGARTSSDTTAIRFPASAQGVAEASFGLNHPKNYPRYALAVFQAGSTEVVVVVGR